MQINKIDNTNFQAIYRLKNIPSAVEEIEKKVIPAYKIMSNENAYTIIGNNPFRKVLRTMIERVAEFEKTSISWVEMNAKNYGLNLNSTEDDVIYFIAGNKELEKFKEYIKKRNDRMRPSIKNLLKKIFLKEEKIITVPDNSPEHIKFLADAMDYDCKETLAFNEYIKGQVKDVKSPRDLFYTMLRER